MASRYMRLSGIVVFAFIVYHLLHFTAGAVTMDPNGLALAEVDAQGRHHVYNMVVSGFSSPIVSGAYIIAMILLGLHINHGASSVFQTLGLKNSKYNGIIEKLGPGLSALIVIGNCSIPIAVLSGIIKGA
jgi:succinate dehydrogenase / fumarate reductase cytochrome b subunit